MGYYQHPSSRSKSTNLTRVIAMLLLLVRSQQNVKALVTTFSNRQLKQSIVCPSFAFCSLHHQQQQRQQQRHDSDDLVTLNVVNSRALRFSDNCSLSFDAASTRINTKNSILYNSNGNNNLVSTSAHAPLPILGMGTETTIMQATLSSSPPSRCTYSSSSSSKSNDPSDGRINRPINIDNNDIISNNSKNSPKQFFGPYIQLTAEESQLFSLLRKVRKETDLTTTLRVAGGWVRDKLLATPEFAQYAATSESGKRLTSKINKPSSMGRQGTKIMSSNKECQPVDIDIALDDMLGREFADHLNEYLSGVGEETVSVGVVLKNPEKSKHLETATMKVESFWIDFVNLRAEEYTQDSRIPDLMRIGTPSEDAFRRDLTINALFYNINNGLIEDWTGRGIDDLRRGIVATPLAPLTTLLDDPLRVLRSIRFAARLRFTMDHELVEAAKDVRVRTALAQKVSRERVGGEVDLMLRSPDPVGAMRLLIDLNLVNTVFPITECLKENIMPDHPVFEDGLHLLTTTHDHLCDCKVNPPIWCSSKSTYVLHGVNELTLMNDEEARRYLWYASFLKPLYDYTRSLPQASKTIRQGRKANRSIICKLLVDELKRPLRDAEAVEKIIRAADDFTLLINSGCDLSATSILLSDIRIAEATNEESSLSPSSITIADRVDGDFTKAPSKFRCYMNGRQVMSATEDDPVWEHAMEFRLLCAKVLYRIGPLWRAALVLSLCEQLVATTKNVHDGEHAIEEDDLMNNEEVQNIIARYDTFAAAMQQIGLIGIWNEKPLIDGVGMKKILPNIPKGPAFRDVMDEQEEWITLHPGADEQSLISHLVAKFPDFAK